MPLKVFQQFFENLHLYILAFIFIGQVFHANTENEVAVTGKQFPDTEVIPRFAKPGNERCIRKRFDMGSVFNHERNARYEMSGGVGRSWFPVSGSLFLAWCGQIMAGSGAILKLTLNS
jgi:hypothetical protein